MRLLLRFEGSTGAAIIWLVKEDYMPSPDQQSLKQIAEMARGYIIRH